MQNRFPPEERPKVLRWLTYGVELSIDRDGRRQATCQKAIWRLLADALATIDQLPDQERRWLSSGTRSGGWSQVGLTIHDLQEIERLRILSAMSPFEEATKVSPEKDAVERSLGVLTFLRWLSTGDDHRLQRAAVLLARGREDQAVRAYTGSARRVSQVVYEIRTQAIGRILRGLREDTGIIPSPDKLRFQEFHDADAHAGVS